VKSQCSARLSAGVAGPDGQMLTTDGERRFAC